MNLEAYWQFPGAALITYVADDIKFVEVLVSMVQ